jgi:hypothetical protein
MRPTRDRRSLTARERQELAAENRKVRLLRRAVDTAHAILLQADITVDEALDIVNATKRRALALFPDKEETYDLIYARRLFRAIEERFGGTGHG